MISGSLACKSMSETIFREISNIDPNERVQVGSYRVDGHGHQQLKEVTFTSLSLSLSVYLSIDALSGASARDWLSFGEHFRESLLEIAHQRYDP